MVEPAHAAGRVQEHGRRDGIARAGELVGVPAIHVALRSRRGGNHREPHHALTPGERLQALHVAAFVVLTREWTVRVGPFQHDHLAAIVGEMPHLALAVEGAEVGRRLADLRLAIRARRIGARRIAVRGPRQRPTDRPRTPGPPSCRRSGGSTCGVSAARRAVGSPELHATARPSWRFSRPRFRVRAFPKKTPVDSE